jgi:hypothetical protein
MTSLATVTDHHATRPGVPHPAPVARSPFDAALLERYRKPPPIPDVVLAVAFRRPYGGLVADRVKLIDARDQPFNRPGGAQWIAIYNCKHVDELQVGVRGRAGALPYQFGKGPDADRLVERRQGPAQRVIGLVFVVGSRLLRLEDIPLSYFFERGRFAWLLAHAVRFSTPVTMEALGLRNGPQGPVRVPGAPLRAALAQTQKDSDR